jgi:DNA-binding NtrC family response regulator
MNKKNILIVDDEVGILLAYKKLLQHDNLVIDTATTIEQAEEYLKEKHYQVVIADLRLTGILGREGLELIRYVKEKHLDTECILVTAYGSPEIKEEALALGACSYFEKPVSGKALKDALMSLNVYG